MTTYDAFVSYSHAEDRGVASRLRAGVEKFAKPWYRPRALRLFLDVSSLSADPGLWSSIERALSDSSWFVLVTSPRAAGSKWVDREVRWWLRHRSPETLLIVVSEGTLAWDSETGDFDASASDALPPALLGALADEPRWVTVAPGPDAAAEPSEAALRNAVVDVAAAIRGVRKEDLEGAAVREHRRTRRWIAGVIAGLSLLLVAALVAGLVALSQRASAIDQARLARARQIATVSQEAASGNLDVAMQLAVHGYRTDANPQTRAALLNANLASPSLVRFLDAGAEVTGLAGSRDGKVAVAALTDGRVLLWRIAAGAARELFRLPEAGTDLAVSDDGSAVAAVGEEGPRCMLWRRGRGSARLPVPAGRRCGAVGLSRSGRTVAYSTYRMTDAGLAAQRVTVASSDELADREARPSSLTDRIDAIAVPSDDSALMTSLGYWEWRRFSDWSGRSDGVGVGARTLAHTISADGRFAIVTSGGSVPIWRTTRPADATEPERSVEVPLPGQTTVALSPDGSRVAVAGPGEIYVTRTVEDAEVNPPDALLNGAVALTGQDAQLLGFANDSRLLSANGSEVAVWDTEQLDRLAEARLVPVAHGCTACAPPSVAVSPDGERVAVVDGFSGAGLVQSLRGARREEVSPESMYWYEYGTPVWAPDGDLAVFPAWSSADEPEPPQGPVAPADDVRVWPVAGSDAGELSGAVAADAGAAILADRDGDVYWQDLESGEEIDFSPAPSGLASEEDPLFNGAIGASGRLLASAGDGVVTVETLPSREVVGRIETDGFADVAFAGSRLLVEREDGALEVWDERGMALERTLPGNGAGGLTASADGSLVARGLDDGRIALEELDTGVELGAFRVPGDASFVKTGLAFSPSGGELIAISEYVGDYRTSMLVRRAISDEALIDAACAAAGAPLTPEQWRSFVGSEPPGDLSCG